MDTNKTKPLKTNMASTIGGNNPKRNAWNKINLQVTWWISPTTTAGTTPWSQNTA